MAAPTPTVAPNPVNQSSTSRTRFIWCPTVADLNNPTVAEISAGTDFTAWIGKDGISGFETSAATTTADSILSGLDMPVNDGRSISGTPTVVFKRTDLAVDGQPADVFVYGVSGVAVLCDAPGLDSAGAKLHLWPAEVGSSTPTWTGLKTQTVAFTPTGDPVERIPVPTV